MPADRTVVTELATALGMLGWPDLPGALASGSPVLHIDTPVWDRLRALYRTGAYDRDFASAFSNGAAFAGADDGLAGRAPRRVEWTGGRRPSGDEVAPIDLRVDRVYLVSCKYLSANIANPSPARLFDGLLATTGTWDRSDWYELVAPEEYQDLYAACRRAAGAWDLPERAAALSAPERLRLRRALGGSRLPADARAAYASLCEAVSTQSAARWSAALRGFDAERMLWRLLRIGNAPYFLLGAHGRASLRLRVDTTWDWHHAYRFDGLSIRAARAGQPRVDWEARYRVRSTGESSTVRGHVEVRWSHGRFGQPPEAKVYLDTRVDDLPGYHSLVAPGEPRAGGTVAGGTVAGGTVAGGTVAGGRACDEGAPRVGPPPDGGLPDGEPPDGGSRAGDPRAGEPAGREPGREASGDQGPLQLPWPA